MLASLYAISYLSVYALAPFLFYWKDVGWWGWSLEATRDDEIQKRWSLTSRRRYSKYLSEKGEGRKIRNGVFEGGNIKRPCSTTFFSFLSFFFLLVLLNTFNTLRCLSRSKDTTAFTRPSSFTSRIQEYSKASRITWHKEGWFRRIPARIRYVLYQSTRVVSRPYVIHCTSSTPHSLRGQLCN